MPSSNIYRQQYYRYCTAQTSSPSCVCFNPVPIIEHSGLDRMEFVQSLCEPASYSLKERYLNLMETQLAF